MSVKVSIVIPCYNQEKYIGECLAELGRQTLADIEIIAVDDGSTDKTRDIIRAAMAKNGKIKLIAFEENRGTLVARKHGALSAVGEYVMFLDPDDLLDRRAAEELYRAITERGVDILMFGTEVVAESKNDPRAAAFLEYIKPKFFARAESNIVSLSSVEQKININLWNKIYKSELIRYAFLAIRECHLVKSEDRYAAFLLFYYADSFTSIPNVYYKYRLFNGITQDSAPISLERFGIMLQSLTVRDLIVKFLEEQEALERYIAVAEAEARCALLNVLKFFVLVRPEDRSEAISMLIRALPLGYVTDSRESRRINRYTAELISRSPLLLEAPEAVSAAVGELGGSGYLVNSIPKRCGLTVVLPVTNADAREVDACLRSLVPLFDVEFSAVLLCDGSLTPRNRRALSEWAEGYTVTFIVRDAPENDGELESLLRALSVSGRVFYLKEPKFFLNLNPLVKTSSHADSSLFEFSEERGLVYVGSPSLYISRDRVKSGEEPIYWKRVRKSPYYEELIYDATV